MSVRRLRAELKDLRGKMELQRRSVFVLVVHGETKGQALQRAGIDADDPAIDVAYIENIYPEELNL
jgi:hypothetical protein